MAKAKPKLNVSTKNEAPQAKSSSKSSPLGLAGASMLGSMPSPKASAAPSKGVSSADPPASPTSPVTPNGLGKAGARTIGSAGSNVSAPSGGKPPASASSNVSTVTGSGSAVSVASTPTATAREKSERRVSTEELNKFHSAVRWAKPWSEVVDAAAGIELKLIACAKDPKNGNTALHIAAQNGHYDLVKHLIDAGAQVNAQNNNGQAPLHMTVAYDFYFVSRLLLDHGADGEIVNGEGNKAILGIDGDKTGLSAWDNAVSILRSASNKEQLDIAFTELDKATETPEEISKEQLIQVGLTKKKTADLKDVWDHPRFMKTAAKF